MGHDSMKMLFSKLLGIAIAAVSMKSLTEVLAMEVGAAFLETRQGVGSGEDGETEGRAIYTSSSGQRKHE